MARPSLLNPGLSRHFEGWQLGVLVVAVSLVSTLLVVPRAVEPGQLPVPEVDRREQSWREGHEQDLARAAYSQELPFEVRAVGERLRRYGLATARGDLERAASELEHLEAIALTSRARHGDQPLLMLRAVQTQLFMSALQRWEATGRRGEELDELGGDFLATARANGWVNGRRFVLTRDERRVLFQVRWARLTGLLEQPPFAPTLNEWRAYYRFLIEHPELGRTEGRAPLALLLKTYVAGIEKRDPRYPALLAHGILQYRRGDYPAAARTFRRYLDERPDGARRSWARNFLLAANRRVQATASGGGSW